MKIRDVQVDHATIQLLVYKFTPFFESQTKRRKGRVGANWRMDLIYIKVKDSWYYLYRAVDKSGNSVDFLLTRRRLRMSAKSFLIKAITNNCNQLLRKNQLINPGISMFKSFYKLVA